MTKSGKIASIIAGPLAAILISLFTDLDTNNPAVSKTAAIAVWMAIWWVTEAVPLAVTSLIPIFIFPFLGILGTKEVAPHYMNHLVFLFIGGFIVAFAMEKWNLHKRIALNIITTIGSSPSRILLGFMLASYFLSMWMLNTSTTMILLPTVLAIIFKLKQVMDESHHKKYSTALLLGIAFSSSIGGTATLIGTAPNLVMLQHYSNAFPNNPEISFLKWFSFGFPVSLIFLSITYLIFKQIYCRFSINIDKCTAIFKKEKEELGGISYEEKVVGIILFVMAILWFTRANIDVGAFKIMGWSNLFPNPKFITDSTVAIFMSSLLFVIPSKQNKGSMVMDWNAVKNLPFGIILLFGGGFALAEGFIQSGLSDWLASSLTSLKGLSPLLVVIIICSFMTFATELTSNTATTQLILPILIVVAHVTDIDPILLMIPATFSASYAFMLPVATPPNAIVFGSEMISIKEMARVGVILNIVGVILMTLAMFTLGKFVF
ncbi:MAG: sodium:dicarboxylate symporter [Bacteroidetes bacterium]|nr:SLC13/DASS family transporter [Bacteroidia bacterium]PCH68083.1 MAG: sodium:dicarboxylate symporter [Bacteroidota bacterium]